jgi:hypothetical protein
MLNTSRDVSTRSRSFPKPAAAAFTSGVLNLHNNLAIPYIQRDKRSGLPSRSQMGRGADGHSSM